MPFLFVQSYDQCKELQDKLVKSFLPLPSKQYNPIDKQSAVVLNMRSIEKFIASILSLEALRTSDAVTAWLRPAGVPLARKSALETVSLKLGTAVEELEAERASHAATAKKLKAAEERGRGRGQRGGTKKLDDEEDDEIDEDAMEEREREREREYSQRDAANVRRDQSLEEVLKLSKLNEGLERELRKVKEEKKRLESLNEGLVKERKKLLATVQHGEELRRALREGDEKRRAGLEEERDAAKEEGKELQELLRVAEVERDTAKRGLERAQRERDAAVMERDAAVRTLPQRDTLASIPDVGSAWLISGASQSQFGDGERAGVGAGAGAGLGVGGGGGVESGGGVAHPGGGRDGGGVMPVSLSPSALSLMNGAGGGRGHGSGAGLVLRGCADGRLLVMGFVEGGDVVGKEGLEVGDEVLEVMGIGVEGKSIGELRRLLGGGGAQVKVRRKEGRRTVEMNVKLPDYKKRGGLGGAVGDDVHVSGTSGWHMDNLVVHHQV